MSINSDGAFRWSDALVLGYGPLDARHEEFVSVVAALQQADDLELPQRLADVAAHLRAHFDEENVWMTETGFPARDCHVDEHAAVLRSLEQVQALLASGDGSECRRFAQELAHWFPGHADYMDAALAQWMCKLRLGGKPVVLRRRLGGA